MRIYCTLITLVGGPPLIYGYLDREIAFPDTVYCLNEQGYIVRGNQQRPMTLAELAALDAEAERCAKSYREENAIKLVVADAAGGERN